MSNNFKPGLYEALITEAVESELPELDGSLEAVRDDLRAAEAADRIALHLARVVNRVLAQVPEADRSRVGVALARELIARIDASAPRADVSTDAPVSAGQVLRSILRKLPDGSPARLVEPMIPLLDTTLLTNAPGEPRVGSQVLTEIASADRIDVVMAFIRYSGIRPLIEVLKRHCDGGKPLRVLTTIYTGSTEPKALDTLQSLGADVRVSYETGSTRLHAKAWVFHRESGFATAYIGSSNLTKTAQHDGLEWNVRMSGARNPDVIEKITAVFDSYWSNSDFVAYDAKEFSSRLSEEEGGGATFYLPPTELRPEPFQERLLEQVELSRQCGHHRNLLAAATGTGKTVMAALDYASLATRLPRDRLLFVAHREEILEKSLATFRHCQHDHAFGELWVGDHRPQHFEHVFASIQTLARAGFDNLAADHFDVVIVDEFHHAAASSYDRLLKHVQPIELLGLTATPERADGLPILHWFDNRIAAELRLWDAIEQRRLSPFAYYGIHDGVDLREVPWRRGRGYKLEELTNVLTADDVRARYVAQQVRDHVSDIRKVRALGFCASIAHSEFMARVFNGLGIASIAVSGETPAEQRRNALSDLASLRINFVFSVDLFNEGVDIPAVDTLLLLRPTESATLFLQQLGRGLRRHTNKSLCTVLDFVGLHRREFRFDLRFRALLGGSREDVKKQITEGFPFLPAGCHMELDPVAAKQVLASIRNAIPSTWNAKVNELRAIAASNPSVSLTHYLKESGLDLEDVYASDRSWSELRAAAGLSVQGGGPKESQLRKACGRMLHIDDPIRIEAYSRLLSAGVPRTEDLVERDRRLLRMLVASTCNYVIDGTQDLDTAAKLLWDHPQVCAELRELLVALKDRVSHLQIRLDTHPNVPLEVHARYTRIEILSAFNLGTAARTPDWREGVRWAEEAGADLLAFTLDKTSGQFSPTTRYKDYAISRDLIHWESQSGTRTNSDTGHRYKNHVSMGTSIMLFARLRHDDRAFWFLGPATYVSHEGERPMAIKWKLRHPLPGDLFAQFAAAVA